MRTKRISSVDISVNGGILSQSAFVIVTVHKRRIGNDEYITNRSYHCYSAQSADRRARFLARAQRMQQAFFERKEMNGGNDNE